MIVKYHLCQFLVSSIRLNKSIRFCINGISTEFVQCEQEFLVTWPLAHFSDACGGETGTEAGGDAWLIRPIFGVWSGQKVMSAVEMMIVCENKKPNAVKRFPSSVWHSQVGGTWGYETLRGTKHTQTLQRLSIALTTPWLLD